MNNHVPQKSTCQKLQELGVELDTEFAWTNDIDKNQYTLTQHKTVSVTDKNGKERVPDHIPAPLLSELYRDMYTVSGEPFRLFKSKKSEWVCHLGWTRRHSNITFSDESNPAEPVCKMLIWSIENNQVNPDEL